MLILKLAGLVVATRKIPIKIHFAEELNPRGSKSGDVPGSSAERGPAASHVHSQLHWDFGTPRHEELY